MKKINKINKNGKDENKEKHAVNPIQWFPGHMAKTRRIIAEHLTQVDIVFELLDARAVISSRNPDIKKITAGKPVLTLLNKSDLADAAVNKKWLEYFKSAGEHALLVDCKNFSGVNNIYPAIQHILSEKLERYKSKGMSGRRIRAMILGIPNVGKSSLLNKLCGASKAKVEDRPGVTVRKQWVSATFKDSANFALDLLDTPGVLWHKFDSEEVGLHLAFIGSIKDDILDSPENASKLCGVLLRKYRAELSARYKLEDLPEDIRNIGGIGNIGDMGDYEIFEMIARNRGFLKPGNEIDDERCAKTILTEFRGAKIGRISLEEPE
jgi:ribosome biogenesis GTPase A